MGYLPSRRTTLKFGRDLVISLVIVALAYVSEHAADLGLGVSQTAVLVAVAGFAFRWARGLTGREPGAG